MPSVYPGNSDPYSSSAHRAYNNNTENINGNNYENGIRPPGSTMIQGQNDHTEKINIEGTKPSTSWSQVLPIKEKEHKLRIYSGWINFIFTIVVIVLISVVQSRCADPDTRCTINPFKGYGFPIIIAISSTIYHLCSTVPFTIRRNAYKKWLVTLDFVAGCALIFGWAVSAWAMIYVQPSKCLAGYEWVCVSGIASIIFATSNCISCVIMMLYRAKYFFICVFASWLG